MNEISVFYSWQSDRPAKNTRNLIEAALKKALKKVSRKLQVALVLDQDARGESGSPNIALTIQFKIRRAAVFVADLTFVAERAREGRLPNGCVSVEWGWAEMALGSGSLIGVMNSFYGGPGELPIDIRENLVRAVFDTSESADAEALKTSRSYLADRLTDEVERSIRDRFFRGFHQSAPQLAKWLVDASSDGASRDRYTSADLARRVGVSPEEARAVMEDLVRYGLAEEAGYSGSGFMILCSPTLFMHFDPLFKGWNADQDAVALAKELAKRSQERVEVLSQDLGMEPRRINPAILRLVNAGFANASSQVPGSSPFVRVSVSSNVCTGALAEGRESMPPIAPRAQFKI